jgi:hypothetical protein
MALVDHDTLAGVEEARVAAASVGIDLIAGTELSVTHNDWKFHMLVYFLEPGSGPLQDRLRHLRDARNIRNLAIVDRLSDLGYGITLDNVLDKAAGESVGRPHIADALVEAGRFPSREEVFRHLLHDGGPAYVERERLSAADAISLARQSNAVPVVAHPITIGLMTADVMPFFTELSELGLGGIEAHHPQHPTAYRHKIEEITYILGIAATGGSDYHGRGKTGYAIGTGTGDLNVPASAVTELSAQRAAN